MLRAVNRVLLYGHPIDSESVFGPELLPPDRAMARRVALTTLRTLGRADHVINRFAKRDPPIVARNILRVALAEIFACQIKPHAAVDLAVRLFKVDRRLQGLSGFANAVLRSAVRGEGEALWNSAGPLQLPDWIAKPVGESFGIEALRQMEAAHEKQPPLDITPKNASETRNLAGALDARQLPGGTLRLQERGQVAELVGFDAGKWWVQDWASALPIRLLGNLHDSTVLDLCSAPGGKAMQCIAAGAKVTALDRSPKRLKILRDNLRRTKLAATTSCCDALEWQSKEKFDVVVVDAPCTATGTIRRHPDLPHRNRHSGHINQLTAGQKQLVEVAFNSVKPGGRVLYSVCSLLPSEGEQVIAWAKQRFNASAVEIDFDSLSLSPNWKPALGGVRTRPDYWPEIGGMDGFYTAILLYHG